MLLSYQNFVVCESEGVWGVGCGCRVWVWGVGVWVSVSEARRADVDLNRSVSDARRLARAGAERPAPASIPQYRILEIRLVAVEDPTDNTATAYSHNRRSANLIRNDNDNRGSGFLRPQAYQRLPEPAPYVEPRPTLKVYEPKEDPRLFYQSDAYLKEALSGQVNKEVAETYPRNDVVPVDSGTNSETVMASMRYEDRGRNQRILGSMRNMCIKCPAERTLIAKPGSDRVIFQKPRLTTCSGQRAPKSVHFARMYGPTFGTLLEKGFHTAVGKVMYKGQTLQLCRVEVQVVTQTCPAPEYLKVHCDNKNSCTFTCRDAQFELYGKPNLVCGYNLQWEGTLPICKAFTAEQNNQFRSLLRTADELTRTNIEKVVLNVLGANTHRLPRTAASVASELVAAGDWRRAHAARPTVAAGGDGLREWRLFAVMADGPPI
ncbi:Sushi repeat-containing protein SRPX [Eumeta japonica]|uniref:Sushi repeat-containing protein SRPX n=1 Tax=Eumeta variegata TaxID=151549 RepID=A0A4C1U6N3_EUMVA|nr:Sushi repeat-containing protein SRPX [Eumeta japonica]